LYAALVGLGIKHLRFDTPDNACPKPASYGGDKARPSVHAWSGRFAVCDFGATLTKDLYICCRNGLTESVPKRTINGLRRTASRRSAATKLAGSDAMLPAFFVRDRALRSSGMSTALPPSGRLPDSGKLVTKRGPDRITHAGPPPVAATTANLRRKT